MKTKRHYQPDYFNNLRHPISVMLVGLGGTGCITAVNLLKMHVSLKALGHRGLHVILVDFDTVTESNMGRQSFYEDDLGRNKAYVMSHRLNIALGEYIFYPHVGECNKDIFKGGKLGHYNDPYTPNILIGCVDNIWTRQTLHWHIRDHAISSTRKADEYLCYYYLDMGNDFNSGQVILGSKVIKQPLNTNNTCRKLLTCIEMMPDAIRRVDDKDNTPSCSLQEAIGKQDLFINPAVADAGCQMLWTLLRQGFIDYNAVFINLEIGEIKRNVL